MPKISHICAAAFVAASFASSASAVSVVNGSFEDPASTTSILSIPASGSLTGWNIASGNIEVILDTYWQASDGNQSIDLNGVQPGSIYQDVVGFTIGHAYRLFFDMSANPLGGANLKTVQASAGGTSGLFQFDRAGRVGYGFGDMQWETNTLDFVATATTMRIGFSDLSGGGAASGPALDNVKILALTTPVPVPAAGGLLMAALAGLGLASRRQRKSVS